MAIRNSHTDAGIHSDVSPYGEVQAYRNLALAVFAQAHTDIKFVEHLKDSPAWTRRQSQRKVNSLRREHGREKFLASLKIWAKYYRYKWEAHNRPVPKEPSRRSKRYRPLNPKWVEWKAKYGKLARKQAYWRDKPLPPMPVRHRVNKLIDSQDHDVVIQSAWEFLNKDNTIWHDWMGFDPRLPRRILKKYEKYMNVLPHSPLGEVD